eukprot:6175574-Pleurochrysis_carterae.AAC.3
MCACACACVRRVYVWSVEEGSQCSECTRHAAHHANRSNVGACGKRAWCAADPARSVRQTRVAADLQPATRERVRQKLMFGDEIEQHPAHAVRPARSDCEHEAISCACTHGQYTPS